MRNLEEPLRRATKMDLIRGLRSAVSRLASRFSLHGAMSLFSPFLSCCKIIWLHSYRGLCSISKSWQGRGDASAGMVCQPFLELYVLSVWPGTLSQSILQPPLCFEVNIASWSQPAVPISSEDLREENKFDQQRSNSVRISTCIVHTVTKTARRSK